MFEFQNVTFGIPIYIAFGLQPDAPNTLNGAQLTDAEFVNTAKYVDQIIINAAGITTQTQFNKLYAFLKTKVIHGRQIQILYNGLATTKESIVLE